MADSQHASWNNYLGKADGREPSEAESNSILFVVPETLSLIRQINNDGSKSVIVGAKGTGKTAICEHIRQKSLNSGAQVWEINDRHRFMNVHVSDFGDHPAEIEAVLLNIIFSELINIVEKNKDDFEKENVDAVRKIVPLREKLTSHFKNFLKSTTVNLSIVEWDFEKILDAPSKTRFTSFQLDPYLEPLDQCFSERPMVILLDDIDDVFLGANRPEYRFFIAGLIRTARRLNTEFKNIYFLVFLKYGIYRSFYDHPLEFDKLRDYILELEWDAETLTEVVSKRIVFKTQSNTDNIYWRKWGKLFSPASKASIEAIRKYLFERCPSGPRDLIAFLNMTIAANKRLKITLQDLEKQESEFSEYRITAIHQDYGYTYPDVHNLVKNWFLSSKNRVISSSYSRGDFLELILELKTDKIASAEFEKHDYFRLAVTSDFARLFYTIGFIGYITGDDELERFVLDDPKGNGLSDAAEYVIHRVFWKALNISN